MDKVPSLQVAITARRTPRASSVAWRSTFSILSANSFVTFFWMVLAMVSVNQHPIEALLAIPLLIAGASHILHPKMWQAFFSSLHSMGTVGVIWRTFALELWPAAVIVAFHQEWSWPGLPLTVYGHMLMAKVVVSMVFPNVGLKSLAMAKGCGTRGFVGAGVFLCILSLFCISRVLL